MLDLNIISLLLQDIKKLIVGWRQFRGCGAWNWVNLMGKLDRSTKYMNPVALTLGVVREIWSQVITTQYKGRDGKIDDWATLIDMHI